MKNELISRYKDELADKERMQMKLDELVEHVNNLEEELEEAKMKIQA
jgi:hypothetical protein